jgi:enoyl-CoA hydratase
MSGVLHSKLDDGIIHLTLDHAARRNALSISLLRDLSDAFRAAADNRVVAAILSGAGNVFSAGADLSDLSATSADSAYDRELEIAGEEIRAFPGPVVAAIDGPCMGAAVDLALACDIRICSTDSFFEVPATRLGLLYNPRAVARLHGRVPSQTLARIFLIGERLSADAAREAGIVARVFAPHELDEAARRLAGNVVGAPPRAVAMTKKLLVALDRGDVDMTAWEALQLEIMDSPERAQAVAGAKARLGRDAAGSAPADPVAKLGGSK